MSIREVKQKVSEGRRHIQEAPAAATAQKWQEVDVASVRLALGSALHNLLGFEEQVKVASTLAEKVKDEAHAGRKLFVEATATSTNADAIDMIAGADAMEELAAGQVIRGDLLAREVGGIAVAVSKILARLDFYDEVRTAIANDAAAAVATQPTVAQQATTYIEGLG